MFKRVLRHNCEENNMPQLGDIIKLSDGTKGTITSEFMSDGNDDAFIVTKPDETEVKVPYIIKTEILGVKQNKDGTWKQSTIDRI